MFREMSFRPNSLQHHRKAKSAPGRRYRRLLRELLEDRSLLSLAPFYLPAQYDFFDRDGFLTATTIGNAQEIALDFLSDRAGNFGLTQNDIQDVKVTDSYVSEDTGVHHIYLRQTVAGFEVANANIGIHVSPEGEIISANGGFVPGLNRQLEQGLLTLTPSLSAEQAVRSAGARLGISLGENYTVTPEWNGTPNGSPDSYVIEAPALSLDEIQARLHFVPTEGGSASLAWQLVVRTPDNQHWYNLSIDAADGDLVSKTDWTSDASYQVLPIPVESPNFGPFETVIDPHTAAPGASPFGWHDTDGFVGAEFFDTRGNNVDAHMDRDGNNSPDTAAVANSKDRPLGGAALDFSGFVFNPSLEPSASVNEDAAMVNLFYWNNILHDVHYLYGFTPAAGNFQANNYAQGGLGSDAVQADAQDNANGGSINNANFATPPDGQVPRMQMYEFINTSPRRDSDIDPGIIIHEYGHGVSNRLTGGPANADALDTLQSAGMGEGWSDWWALMLTQRSAAETTAGRGVGTYVLGQSPSGPGIREYRYDFDIGDPNQETFKAYGLGSGQDVEVHWSGTLWASALWDINHLFIQKYGFEPNIYDTSSLAGNIRAMHLVMTALKLQPANPTFVQARDAILVADSLLYGGINHKEIWEAFARRGLGEFANTSNSNSTAFDTSFATPGLAISGSNPANGDVVTTPLTSFVIHFSDPVVPDSVNASDLLVAGAPADSVTLSDGDRTATFVFNTSPLSSNNFYTMSVEEDSIERAGDNDLNDAFSATFHFGNFPLAVVDTTPAGPNRVFLLPPVGAYSLDVHFNQPIDPNSVTASDLVLSTFRAIPTATVLGAIVLPDNLTARFTISTITGQGAFTATIGAGNILDAFGAPNNPFTAVFNVDGETSAFPTLTAKKPPASLIYDPTITGYINFAGDTDAFTLPIDPGQTVTIAVTPTTTAPGLRPVVQLIDPSGTILDTATSAGANQRAILQTIAALNTSTGSYQVAISSADGTNGSFSLQIILNAALEKEGNLVGETNNTALTAQDLNPSLVTIAPQQSIAQRGAVLGVTEAGSTTYAAAAVPFSFTDISLTGTTQTALTGTDSTAVAISIGFTFNLFGTNFTSLIVTSNGLITFTTSSTSGVNNTLSSNPTQAAIAPFWDDLVVNNSTGTARVKTQLLGTAGSRKFVIQWDKVTFASGGDATDPITFQAVLNEGSNSVQFNYLDLVSGSAPGNNGASATAGIKRANTTNGQFVELINNGPPNAFVGMGLSTLITPQAATPDYYSMTFAANDSVSLAVSSQGPASDLTLELRNSADVVVQTAVGGITNVGKSISNFVVTTPGTYYARIAGGSNISYSLVATRNAAFELEPNDSVTTPRPIGTNAGVLGAITPPIVPANLAIVDGSSGNGFPFNIGAFGNPSMRYQQLYSRTEFEKAGTINAIRFRRDAGQTTFSTTGISIQINLGYAAAGFAAASSTFANNVGPGSTTVLNTTSLTLSSSATSSPNPFDIVIPLTTPFLYDPSQGDLLMDVFLRNSPSTRFFDSSTSSQQASMRRVFSTTNVNATTGTIATDGLVTRFDMTNMDDWHSININSTATLVQLVSTTPAYGSGQFINNVSNHIELYNPSNALVASGTNLAGSRNEFIQFTPTVTGTYKIRVSSESGTGGEYFISTSDPIAPRVVDTSVEPDAILTPGSLSLQVTFSETMRSANLSSGDFTLRGNLRGVNYSASSFSFNTTGNAPGTVVTLSYANLPGDNYTLTLISGTGSFTDAAGNNLDGEFSGGFPSGNGVAGGNFVMNFSMDAITESFPTLVSKQPLGSLIYDPSLIRAVNFAGDTDSFTLPVDPGQTISVLVDEVSAALRARVELRDPLGNLVASQDATAPGQPVFLNTVGPTVAGDYSVTVSGLSSTVGVFTVQFVLNAALEVEDSGGGANDTTSAAQDVNASALILGGSSSRLGALGAIRMTSLRGSENFESGVLPASITTYSSDAGGRIRVMSPVSSGNSSAFALVMDRTPSGTLTLNEAVYTVDLSGVTQANLSFSHVSISDETHALPLPPTSFTGHFNGDGVSISDDGNRWWTVLSAPTNTTWTTTVIDLDAAAAAAGMTLGPNFRIKFQQYDDFPLSSDGRGYDNIQVLVAEAADTYQFELAAGESATVAVTSFNASSLDVELLDGVNPPVLGQGGATNVTKIIGNYEAPITGTYYVRITAEQEVPYSLVITKNAAFDTESNETFAEAQPLDEDYGALGAIEITSSVVPAALAAVETNSGNSFPFSGSSTNAMRYQQIYSASEFLQSGIIDAIRFRRSSGQLPFTSSAIDLTVNLGYAATTVATASSTFADNVGSGAVTVYSGPVVLSSNAAAASPQAFDILLDVANLFDYNPALGDLLLDFTISSDSLSQFFLGVSALGQQTSTTRIYNPTVAAATGTVGFTSTDARPYGLITRFDFADEDWYSFDVSAASPNIRLQTSTPADGTGQFVNTLNPHIELYDPSGALVTAPPAIATVLPDGRNESIDYHLAGLASGTYRVRVTTDAGSLGGEYFLSALVLPNTKPVAASDAAITNEDFSTEIDVLANDSDDDGTVDPTSVEIKSSPAHGSAVVDPVTHKVTYTPALNYNGADSFTYVIRDDNGAVSDAGTVNVTVLAINDVTGFDVQKGANQRSFIRYLDLVFENDQDLSEIMLPTRTKLTRYGLDGVSSPTAISLGGVINSNGNKLNFDFGAQGVGGNRNTTAGDGYYKLEVDTDGDGEFECVRTFFRLFGDANGDQQVGDADFALILSQYSSSPADNADGDINGDGYVNAQDRTFAIRSRGRKLANGLWIDD